MGTFTLDPENPALLEQILVHETDLPGDARIVRAYGHRPGAGPRLVFLDGATEVALSTAGPSRVQVDPDGFSIVEDGPLRVMVRLKGHFSDPTGRSLCRIEGDAYERFVSEIVIARQSLVFGIGLYDTCAP